MCLAIPVKIIEVLPEAKALVELSGVKTIIATDLIDKPALGDYVIVHVGYALEKLNTEQANASLAAFKEAFSQDDKA